MRKDFLQYANFSQQSAEFEVPAEFEGFKVPDHKPGRKVFAGKVVLKPYEALCVI